MPYNPHSRVAQVLQIGVESTEGTLVPAGKQLPSLMAPFTGDGNFTSYRPSGSKYTTVVIQGQEWTTAPITGPMTYGEIVYPLSSIVNFATPTTSLGITTWTFTPSSSNPDTSKSFSFEWGDSTSAYNVAGAYFNDLTLKFDRKSCDISGNIMARRFSAGVTLTGSPTVVENIPMSPAKIDVYYAADFATLTSGPTQLTNAFAATFALGKRFNPFWPLNSSLTSFGGRTEAVPTANVTLSIGADTASSDFIAPVTLAAMRAGSTIYMRFKFTGPTLAASNYSMTIDCALKVVKPWKFEDIDGSLLGLGWDFDLVTDATANKAYQIIVLNATTAL